MTEATLERLRAMGHNVRAQGTQGDGHSIVVDPWGRVLAEGGTEPGVVLARIDPALVDDARARIPALKHTRPVTVAADRRRGAKDAA